MTRTSVTSLLISSLLSVSLNAHGQSEPRILNSFDTIKNRTTLRLAPAQLSGQRSKYQSLHFGVFCSYPGKTKQAPETVSVELLTVVRARLLDPDLYVVFLVDGADVFLSSDRSAIRNPLPGKRWIGERLVFRMDLKDFLRFASAQKLSVKLDALSFDFSEEHLRSLREFARAIKG